MSSVKRFYAQRDNRLVDVPLTGYVTNNGVISGAGDNLYQPAIATLDVNYSQLFIFTTQNITLRTDSPPSWYLVGIQFPAVSPPRFYPGFEINIIINVKDTNVPTPLPMVFQIQINPSVPLDYADESTYMELVNVDYADSTPTDEVYTYGNRVITLLSTGTRWVIKSSYLNNGPSSPFM